MALAELSRQLNELLTDDDSATARRRATERSARHAAARQALKGSEVQRYRNVR
jgi:hypothetical protein